MESSVYAWLLTVKLVKYSPLFIHRSRKTIYLQKDMPFTVH